MKKNYFFMGGFLCLYLALAPVVSSAQTLAFNRQNQVTTQDTQSDYRSIHQVLRDLEAKHSIFFMFHSEKIKTIQVQYRPIPGESVQKTLDRVLKNNGLNYKRHGKIYAIFPENMDDKSIREFRQKMLQPDGNQSSLMAVPNVDPLNELPGRPVASVSSQPVEEVIRGRVVSGDNNGELPGVSIVLKGTTRGTTTDNDGNYQISVPNTNAVLVFSFVGYISQEITVGNRATIDLRLEPDQKALDEVVVVGYGTVKKSDLTGSVAQVKSKDLNSYPTTNVLQALSGRAAGVQVLQNTGAPGGSVSVRIRGVNSIQGSNEPLYVVDGFPTSGSNPTVLNNADIENIEILKDASATAIYGSRGANGVVLITTKRGKSGRTNVDFETSYSSQTLRKKLDLMDGKEYATFYNEQAANDKLKPYFTQEQIDGFGKGFDWQDFVFQRAPMKTSALTISGGTEKTQFSISGSAFNQDGIIRGSDYNRYSLRTNINHSISRKLTFNLASTLTQIKTNARNSQGGNRGGSLTSGAISAPPVLTPTNDDGSYRMFGTTYAFISALLVNPINSLNEQSSQTKGNRVLTNAAFIYNPIPEITIKVAGGIENSDDRTDNYTTNNYVGSQGSAGVSTSQFTSLLNENTISYNKTIRERHSISAVVGFTYQDFVSTSLNGSGQGYISNSSQTFDLAAAGTPGIPGSGYSKSSLLSYLGRVNYAFNSKYLATFSFRADGSSKYSEGDKWGYFPSGALAWRLSNEDFLKDNMVISDLKLRASWGLTGSQAIGPYATLNQLVSSKTIFGDALYTAYAPGTNLPGNLKWETTEQKDIGIDFGILGNRIVVTADYYLKNTRDLLNTVQLPSSLGFTTTIQNVGEVQNKGVELGVSANLFSGDFKWDINTNIAFNRNKVVKLYGGQDILGGFVDISAITDTRNILREGQPMGRFWGYMEDGFDDKGKIKYRDLDGDGAITIRDKTYIGDPNPDFIYGINSSMSYRNFDFTIFIQGTQGNDIFNTSSINNTVDYGYGLNMPREVFLNHWTPTNPTAKYPVISSTTRTNVSDRFVEDGSYMRLKNILLAYNFPLQKWGINWIRTAQVYASGQNLLTLTKYSWWDPEVNSNGGANSTAQGFDQYSYPTSKSVTFGIRVGF